MQHVSMAQIPNCDSLVPTYNVDFTGSNAGTTWTSPTIVRDGSCCGTIAPDRCVDFILITDSQTIGVCVSYCPYVPNPGSLICYIDCNNPFQMGSMWSNGFCIDTGYISIPGIHYVTFCKPGNLAVEYCITSVTAPLPASVIENNFISFAPSQSGNPSLSLTLTSPQTFSLQVFSSDGKMISKKNYSLGSGRQQIAIPTENLEAGIYFVRIKTEDNIFVKKLIKQ
jgi:hypothetical protein